MCLTSSAPLPLSLSARSSALRTAIYALHTHQYGVRVCVCVFVCFAFLKNKFLIASRPTEADYSPNNLALEAAAAKPIAKEFAA